jgi:uncharacterized protein YecE (DUF72 family)
MGATTRIGCSGWTYDDWRGPFYPETVKLKDRLSYYASVFDTVELNGSFYRLPSENAVKAWPPQVPDGFLFAWKVSRFITHNKKLKDCQDSVDLVFGRMAPLGEKRGSALVQLPPMLHRDDERLKRFLSWIPRGERVTVEFRHDSWYDPAVLGILRDHARRSVCPTITMHRRHGRSPPISPMYADTDRAVTITVAIRRPS